ncbi:MAG: response regulator transcription factor [Chloroflexota bacterium]|nr:response regulator transcription factor [Chloroflexota bacterium]
MAREFRVLAIDDEPEMLKLLETLLSRRGFDVVVASDAHTGLRAAYRTRPDAILLDVMMPGMDGFDVCRRLKEATDAPILFVTALDDLSRLKQGFALGADDYVVKPFRASELISRLKASLRRVQRGHEKQAKMLFADDSVMINCSRREAVIEGRSIQLTPIEFDVLKLLIQHAGTILSTDAILTRVWGSQRTGNEDVVKHTVYRLRQKIEPIPESPQYLHTVRGRGYTFTA